jgi:hypothetical protein
MLEVARQAGFMVVDTDAWKVVTAPDARQVLALKAAPRTIPELRQARGWLIAGGVPCRRRLFGIVAGLAQTVTI